MLGLVYTMPEGRKELRALDEKRDLEDEKCVDEALESVESGRQMEGVLDIEGKGKVGFLVYRLD